MITKEVKHYIEKSLTELDIYILKSIIKTICSNKKKRYDVYDLYWSLQSIEGSMDVKINSIKNLKYIGLCKNKISKGTIIQTYDLELAKELKDFLKIQ